MIKLKFTLFFVMLSTFSFAQNEKIETDRPGQNITPSTTPNKWIQSELGFERLKYKFFNNQTEVYKKQPTILLKYGIGNKFEIRFFAESINKRLKVGNGTFTDLGLNNMQIGGKFNFLKQSGIIPKTSIIAHYRLNGLNNSIFSDSINGGNITLAMQHTVSENFSIGYNLGVDKRSWQYSPMYTYTFSPRYDFTEKWQAFVEIFGYFWSDRIPKTSVDGGLSYYINNNIKIDASAGLRINKDINIKFYSVGASYRFKTEKSNN